MTFPSIRSRIRPSGVVRVPTPTAPLPDAPIVACRHCGAIMEARPWPCLGDWIVTCRQPCPLRNQTFTASRYGSIDLSKYRQIAAALD